MRVEMIHDVIAKGPGNALCHRSVICKRFVLRIDATPPFACNFVGVFNSREREFLGANCRTVDYSSCPTDFIVAYDELVSHVRVFLPL